MHGDDSMLTNQYGAPVLPPGITGSISHKDDLAVGVASLDSAGRVGVDLERCSNKAAATLARRILSEGEGCSLGVLEGVDIEEDVLLRFSFKEAVYKALHAYLPRAIDFSEVEVFPKADGSAELRFLLKGGEQFPYEASWQRYLDRYWLTCVYLQPPDSGGAGTDIS
jgi:4'-phosphopantetheinyl transferase EntD